MVEPVIIGNARLILGDCRDVLPTLGKVGHIITDPPYSERTHAGHDAGARPGRDGAERADLGYGALSVEAANELRTLNVKATCSFKERSHDFRLRQTAFGRIGMAKRFGRNQRRKLLDELCS